jgi:anti-sigma factor RsiW
MTCEMYHDLVAAHVDGQLTAAEWQAVAEHLHGCPPCQQLFSAEKQFQAAWRARRSLVPVPVTVERRLRAALMAEPSSLRFSWAWVRQWLEVLRWRPRVIAALATAGVLLTFALSQWFSFTQEPASFSLAREYYQEAENGRLTVVYKTDDPHALEATLNHSGSLDFQTRVADFRPAGYHLRGGKVERATTHPVAVVVYKGSEGQIVCLRQKGTMPPPPHGAKLLNDHMYVYVRAGLTAVYSQSQDHFCILMSAMSPETFLQRLALVPAP